MTFQEKYKHIYNLVKPELDVINKELTMGLSLPQPLYNSLKEFLLTPSKKIRLLISLLYLKAKNFEITERIYSHLTSVELVHNASLIHDDVIDDDNIRRNNKTLNSKFNNKLAIISGDYLLSVALERINKLNSPQLTSIYTKTLQNMCFGETTQYFNRFKMITIEDYIVKCGQKTASLFETALCGSLILSQKDFNPLAYTFANSFGIAFQIRDDLLNITSANSSESSTDIQNGVYNAPVIYAEGIENLSVGIEKTKLLLENFIEEGKTSLRDIEDNEYKKALITLLELLKND